MEIAGLLLGIAMLGMAYYFVHSLTNNPKKQKPSN